MSVEKKTLFKACGFCGLTEDNELKYGKFYDHDGIVTHYYCLLLSSNMEQKGNDDEGILGFLTNDIQKEIRRGKKLACSYCKKTGATLGCCNVKCKKIFHFPCGLKDGSLHQFFGEFRTYCRNHRPKQQVDSFVEEEIKITADKLCYICYDIVSPCDINTLWAPCCKKNAWFHRKCIQQLAMSAGYFFKCPLCNNKKEFQKTMLEFGIFIPNQDASWELVPNAFQELLYRHDQCDAITCLCPKGRKHISSNAKWELTLCRICGSQGIHMACGQLKWANPVWECEECTSILSRAAKPDRFHASAITVPSNNQHGRLSHGSSWPSSDDSDTDISVGCYSPLPPTAATSNNETIPQSAPVKMRPGPRSFKLQQQFKANKMSESEVCRNIVFEETCNVKEKIGSPDVKHAYTNDENIYAEEYILHNGSNSTERNENNFSNERSKIINFTPIQDADTVTHNNLVDNTKHSTRTLARIKRICTRDYNNSTALDNVFSVQSKKDASYKLLASEPKHTLSPDAAATSSSSNIIKHLSSLNAKPAMNSKITNITSLFSGAFAAGVSHLHSNAINAQMTSTISEQDNCVELNMKRKSEVHKEVYDPKLERLKKVKKHENVNNQSSAPNNDICHVNKLTRNQLTSTTVSSLPSEVLGYNAISHEEQCTDVTVPLLVPDNLTAMGDKHGLFLTHLPHSRNENDSAIKLSNYNNVRNLAKTKTFADSVSKTYDDLSAATNCFRDTDCNLVNQSTISSSMYNKNYEKRRKVYALPSSDLTNYTSDDTQSNISLLPGCNSSIDSAASIFSQVTSNPNTCERLRLIPEYVHLRDLKFHVVNSDYIQMILYDTFSVTLNLAKCVNGNLRLNCKSLQRCYESKGFSQAEHINENFSRQGTIECNLKCSNNFLDYLAYVSSNVDIRCKELPTANRISGDDDDAKENLDPVSSPIDCQSSLNLSNAVDRKTKLKEYFYFEDQDSLNNHISHNVNTTFLRHMVGNKNGKIELFDSNLTTNKSVPDSRGGNSEQNTSPTNKYLKDCECCTDSIDHQENPLLYAKRLQNSIRKLKNIHVPSSDVKCLDPNSIPMDVLKKQNTFHRPHFLKDSIVSLREMRRVHSMSCKVSIDLRKIQKLLDSKPDLFCKYL